MASEAKEETAIQAAIGRKAPREVSRDWYPEKQRDSQRPFRIWNSNAKKPLPRRCYGTDLAAMKQCSWLIQWEKVDTAFEVIDVSKGKWIATYAVKIIDGKAAVGYDWYKREFRGAPK